MLVDRFKQIFPDLTLCCHLGGYRSVLLRSTIEFLIALAADKTQKGTDQTMSLIYNMALDSNIFSQPELVQLTTAYYIHGMNACQSQSILPMLLPVEQHELEASQLQCLVDMAMSCDEHSGRSICTSFVLHQYQAVVSRVAHADLFIDPDEPLLKALTLGSTASSHEWYKEVWGPDTARVVLESLSDVSRTEQILNVAFKDMKCDAAICVLWVRLESLYSLTNLFEELGCHHECSTIRSSNTRVITDFMYKLSMKYQKDFLPGIASMWL